MLKGNKTIRIVLSVLIAMVSLLGIGYVIYRGVSINTYPGQYTGRTAYRVFFCLCIVLIVYLHIWLDWKKMYHFLYQYRWILAIGLFAFMVLNKFHFSSLGCFDAYIQPGEGSQYVSSIIGTPRGIRSDEWLVSTPAKLSTRFAGVGKTNNIPMARELDNLTASGLEWGWSALAKPYDWGYYTGNTEIGIAFDWNYRIIFMWMFAFEFCMLITGRKKKLSCVGACLLGFSSFYLWWSSVIWMLAGMAAIVCFYYTLMANTKLKRLFYGIGTAIFASCYVVNLYPAWQVPAGFMFLIYLTWLIVHYRKRILKFDYKDWLIIVGSIVFMISIIVAYLLKYQNYMNLIMNTVYPGSRVSNGGFILDKLFYYIGQGFYSIWDVGNPCEYSVIFNLFPLPFILGIAYMVYYKKWNGLLGGLGILSLFLTAYCWTGIPMGLAKITLMTYSTPERAADVLALAQLMMLLIVVAKMPKNKVFQWGSIGLLLVVLAFSGYKYMQSFPSFLSVKACLFSILLILGLSIPWAIRTKEQVKTIATMLSCIVLMGIGLSVHPLMKGLDMIYSKPVANEIMEITQDNPNAKWIVVNGLTQSGYLIACGAPTINSTNIVPNYELWDILDPEHEYEDYWNRYAHIVIQLDTDDMYIELPQGDYMILHLPIEDLKKIGVEYIYAPNSLKGNDDVILDEIYNSNGSYIYKVNIN